MFFVQCSYEFWETVRLFSGRWILHLLGIVDFFFPFFSLSCYSLWSTKHLTLSANFQDYVCAVKSTRIGTETNWIEVRINKYVSCWTECVREKMNWALNRILKSTRYFLRVKDPRKYLRFLFQLIFFPFSYLVFFFVRSFIFLRWRERERERETHKRTICTQKVTHHCFKSREIHAFACVHAWVTSALSFRCLRLARKQFLTECRTFTSAISRFSLD